MNKILKFVLFILIGIVFMLGAIVLLPDQYEEIYQRAIANQYEYYKTLDDEKIVFIGNSSLMFGFDIDRMEELTGKKCVILGGHVSYGLPFFTELSKCNLHAGDTVVIELASGLNIDSYNVDLLLPGIGKNYSMYRFFPKYQRKAVIERYPKYVKDSFNYMLNGGYHSAGVYSQESTDYRGAMVYERGECEIPAPYEAAVALEDEYAWFEICGFEADEAYCDYMNEYTKYCEAIGVRVLFTCPCYLDEAVTTTKADLEAYDKSWSSKLNGTYVSNSYDYLFSREYIYNQAAHCNSKGAILRTEKLYDDIKEYL